MKNAALFVVLFFMAGVASAADFKIAYWDHDGTDINGAPDTVTKARYAVAPANADLNTDESTIVAQTIVDITVDNDAEIQTKIADKPASIKAEITAAFRADDVTALLASLQKNKNYRLFVQVSDASDNWSLWTASVDVIDKTPPKAPSKLSCK